MVAGLLGSSICWNRSEHIYMKIMVTGDQGYIGAILVPMLQAKGYEVVGYDAGFF